MHFSSGEMAKYPKKLQVLCIEWAQLNTGIQFLVPSKDKFHSVFSSIPVKLFGGRYDSHTLNIYRHTYEPAISAPWDLWSNQTVCMSFQEMFSKICVISHHFQFYRFFIDPPPPNQVLDNWRPSAGKGAIVGWGWKDWFAIFSLFIHRHHWPRQNQPPQSVQPKTLEEQVVRGQRLCFSFIPNFFNQTRFFHHLSVF